MGNKNNIQKYFEDETLFKSPPLNAHSIEPKNNFPLFTYAHRSLSKEGQIILTAAFATAAYVAASASYEAGVWPVALFTTPAFLATPIAIHINNKKGEEYEVIYIEGQDLIIDRCRIDKKQQTASVQHRRTMPVYGTRVELDGDTSCITLHHREKSLAVCEHTPLPDRHEIATQIIAALKFHELSHHLQAEHTTPL